MKKRDYIKRACDGLPITEEEHKLLLKWINAHTKKCPNCSSKGEYLKRYPYTLSELSRLPS